MLEEEKERGRYCVVVAASADKGVQIKSIVLWGREGGNQTGQQPNSIIFFSIFI